jgi:hypothetical protein
MNYKELIMETQTVENVEGVLDKVLTNGGLILYDKYLAPKVLPYSTL